jgi:HlyD family secretion protein
MNRNLAIGVVLAVLAAVGLGWWLMHREGPKTELVLYGDVDLRQVELAFNATERISEVDAKEGDKVKQGQVLARLDVTRLQPQADQADATAKADAAILDKLRHGSRPEEIEQARANLAADEATAADAERKHDRLANLLSTSAGRALSKQEVDDAKFAADQARARARSEAAALKLAVIGPRKEDIEQAAAQLKAAQAQAALYRRQLVEAELVAPRDAVIRSRLVEPGDISAPGRAAFTLALVSPKWVRAYVSETDLAHVKPGQAATVAVDAFPNKRFSGWVGFISPVAEFTPKTVETPELRSNLVYEIRVFVNDPGDDLRLGQPATVRVPLASDGSQR